MGEHEAAARCFDDLTAEPGAITHNYVVLEASALVQRRLGSEATRDLLEELVPALEIRWVGAELHDRASAGLLAAGRRRVSLVDWVSFEVMRRHGIERAFAFDRDFVAQGFETVP